MRRITLLIITDITMRLLLALVPLALTWAAPVAELADPASTELQERFKWWENVTISDVAYRCQRETPLSMFNCSLLCKSTGPKATFAL